MKSEGLAQWPVTLDERQARNGHKGAVIWVTGLSGSGKTTFSRALERVLFQLGMQVCTLDGDSLRRGLNADVGFSWLDRHENVRRVAEVATIMARAGMIVIAALISPCAEDRRRARGIAEAAGQTFLEVFLDTPLEVCEARDSKGLYSRARAGEIEDFTGISSPYEKPLHADVTVHREQEEVGSSVARIVALLRSRLVLPPEP